MAFKCLLNSRIYIYFTVMVIVGGEVGSGLWYWMTIARKVLHDLMQSSGVTRLSLYIWVPIFLAHFHKILKNLEIRWRESDVSVFRLCRIHLKFKFCGEFLDQYRVKFTSVVYFSINFESNILLWWISQSIACQIYSCGEFLN